MWELDCEEGWAPKNWCFLWCWRRLLRVPWTARRANQSILKEINPEGLWKPFTGRADAEAESPILWPSDVKSWLIGRDPDAGKDWRQKEKRAAENEMVRQQHWLNGNQFEQTLGDTGHMKHPLPTAVLYTGHSKHPLPTTQEKILHMDITRWSIPKSDWLYSLQPKMEKFYTVSKNKTRSWLWLRSWTPYFQIQT